jgi:inner membrane transporter RhtA
VVLAALGILLLADPGGGSMDGVGVAFALAAGLCWFAYILLAARAGQRFTGGSGLAMAMAVAALVPLVPGLLVGGAALLRPELLAIGLAVSVLSTVIPFTLETESLRRMPTAVFGVLMSLEPAVAAVAGLIVLGQRLAARELVAIGLVVAASAGATRYARPPPEPA